MSNIPQEQAPDNKPDVSNMSTDQILIQDNWKTLIRIKFPGCDLSFYRIHRNRILANAVKQKSESDSGNGQASHTGGKPSRKINYAAQVLSSGERARRVVYRAMGELVERVNEEGEDGE